MKSFRSKAAHFFREGASSEEKVAINNTSSFDFDAGIDSTVTRKVVWPFRRKNDKADRPQPALRLSSSSSTLMPPARPCVIAREASDDFDLLPDYDDSDDDTQAFRRSPGTSNKKKMYRSAFSMSNLKKSCSNLAALKNNGPRIFSSNKKTYSRSPPPPPVPQIPVDFTIPLPTRYSTLPPPPPPPLPKRSSNRPRRPALKKAKSSTGPISRPTPTSQDSNVPLLLEHLTTTPFTPRNRSPPQRPPRPNAVENDTLMHMRHTNARMVLPVRPRPDTTASPDPCPSSTSTSTASPTSSSSSSSSSTRHASAIASRLGIPTGHSAPRTASLAAPLAAPLAARIPQHHPALRLPVCGADGSTRYSRFSEFVAHCQPAAYQPLAPPAPVAEVYDRQREPEWVLERHLTHASPAAADAGGMVFRDRNGGFHFVANI
ncbi:hypothetical protein COCC4DRAFT_25844 [Bipolaris maydis ATCC 48331]|uniref:Uncharacterized protein n=1 Tax=Cochliobolus heterostrophus (strain C4 / ATCC 48331 / race T) TaxID=665024 RepID=N4X7V2_COCH4|nr:uncharacterized protein COCC4DRAFT_25844 [Bipolaris maydis ATCC 48331]ENI02626.1 hypothetical protein COCC4DRAFT_25844 [Bipolaris maydis ATCC 48331]KAJ5037887.1 hypothetical protein J3E74DRAFT_296728 [Bipolaris maydis]KAJ5061232.1 hypothetical protein J3E74DRAFT_290062 [Bipolaris maydis]KAJ6210504.1 hypothetical protein PSV09DRAFT_2257558 [Bipolaris maydis]